MVTAQLLLVVGSFCQGRERSRARVIILVF